MANINQFASVSFISPTSFGLHKFDDYTFTPAPFLFTYLDLCEMVERDMLFAKGKGT